MFDYNKFSDTTSLVSMKERVFHFSKEKVTQLKSKANAEVEIDKISFLQAVLAHLWRSIICYDNRHADRSKESSYHLINGARSRLNPPLPEAYFGNAVKVGMVTIKVGDLLELGLGYVALEMNKMVALYNKEDKFMSFLESWVEEPELLTEDNIASNALVTCSSPQIDVYKIDFGWGSPIAVRSGAGNKSQGKMTIFCGVEEGSIDVKVFLLHQTLLAMGNDSEFMDGVSVY